ncbi:MAG: PorT family protein [Culturomica sp.]|jgi:hypothetical protein|nr:PorT family protein [Culturomica sp.]
MKKFFLITIIILTYLSNKAFTQNNYPDYKKHEFSVWVAGGAASLKYGSEIISKGGSFGGMYGLGYSFYLNDRFGLGTGVELAYYNATVTIDKINEQYTVNADNSLEAFDFRSSILNYKEKQFARYLNIPIMAQYQQVVGKNRFYGAAGIKIGLPMNTEYETEIGEVTNSAYYHATRLEDSETAELGLGRFYNRSNKEKFDFSTAYSISLEFGAKWNLSKKFYLYTLFFLDYGLNNVNNDKNSPEQLVNYNSSNPQDFSYGSVLYSSYADDNSPKRFAEKVNPMAVGIKIKIGF